MAELQYIKELLSTGLGTEGQLLIPRKIADTLVDEVLKILIPMSEVALHFGPEDIPGSSIDVDLLTPNSMSVRAVAEGAEVPLDQMQYTSFNMKPVKYGVAIRITRELLEDAKWNLLENNVEIAGRRIAENMTSHIISDALDNATNSIACGATVQITNIARAIEYLHDQDYMPTTFLVGMKVLNDLQQIDTFVEYLKVGNTDMLEKGFLGTIYGMNVLLASSNAGMTTTSAYVFDNRHAIAFAEKRPLTVENFELATFDMTGAVVTQRFATRHIRAQAICKLTSNSN